MTIETQNHEGLTVQVLRDFLRTLPGDVPILMPDNLPVLYASYDGGAVWLGDELEYEDEEWTGKVLPFFRSANR